MTSFTPVRPVHVNDRSKDTYVNSVVSSPSSASSTSDDIFSNGDARSSQSSAPSSVKGSPLNYDSEASGHGSYNASQDLEQSFSQASVNRRRGGCHPVVAAELRRHPRRTCANVESSDLRHDSAARKPVPNLIRQCDRKEQFVEALVDTTTEMIEVIWPLSVAQCNLAQGAKNILGLRKFVQEVLRRSKTSYSTLQVALFYLVLLIPFVPRPEVPERREDPPVCRALRCGRRMFLAALILASKYLQDRNYTMLAWAKISGLKKEEICFNELAFLRTVDYDLHIPEQLFKDWADIVLKYSLEDECRRARALNGGRCEKWRAVVPCLTRDLSAVTNPDADMFARHEGLPWPQQQQYQQQQQQQWTPPTSPVSSALSSRSVSPPGTDGFVKPLPPPPQFLEPRAMTTVEMGLRSPKPSKLETPCLPPISFDYTPAASGSRCNPASLARSSMGLAMKQAGAVSMNRACVEGFPMAQRVKTMPCSRRSCLSTSSSSPIPSPSPSQMGGCDTAVWRKKAAGCAAKALRARESCLRASSSVVEPSCDEAAFAARTLQDISRGSSAYPTPMSLDSCNPSDSEDVSTPKATDAADRPVVRTARKRERPLSICESEGESKVFAQQQQQQQQQQPQQLAGIIKHAGGIPVDYGAGIDDFVVHSRHARSASGSCDGARKRNRMIENAMSIE